MNAERFEEILTELAESREQYSDADRRVMISRLTSALTPSLANGSLIRTVVGKAIKSVMPCLHTRTKPYDIGFDQGTCCADCGRIV